MGLKELAIVCGALAFLYTAKLVDTNIKLNQSPRLSAIRQDFGEVVRAGPETTSTQECDGNTRTVLDFGGNLDYILGQRNQFLHLSKADPFFPIGWNTDRSYSGKYGEKAEYIPGLCGVLTLNAFARPDESSVN